MSNPCSIGRNRAGVRTVFVDDRRQAVGMGNVGPVSGSPGHRSSGFPGVSRYTARVFSSTSLLRLSGLLGSKNRTSIPSLEKVCENRVQVPP